MPVGIAGVPAGNVGSWMLAQPQESVIPGPECAQTEGTWCAKIYNATDITWLAKVANEIVGHGIAILFILGLAIVLRFLLGRLITRFAGRLGRPRAASRWRPRRHVNGAAPDGSSSPSSALSQADADERKAQRARTIASLLRSVASAVIYGVAFVMVLAELSINIAPVIASAGVLGIAVAFGAQSLVSDFLSGIFMMLEDQYGVGDWVDTGEASGEVEAVGLRITTVRDLGGVVWYVRNGEIVRLGNYTQGFGVAVVDIPLSLHADAALAGQLAEQTAREVAAENAADVVEEPVLYGVQAVSPYGITLRLTVKTRAGTQFGIQRTLNRRIQATLTANDIPGPAMPLGA